jgi:addiction module HigA family antidote
VKKRPIYPIHPGEILADELAELDKSPAALARELHIPANRISQLVAGKRAMTADTALRLEKWLGVSASFWMNLQKRYELDIARDKTSLKAIKPIRLKKRPMDLQHELRP